MSADGDAVLASIELQGVTTERPHTTVPNVRVRVFTCGCQINDRAGQVTGSWLCQYHNGYIDGYDTASEGNQVLRAALIASKRNHYACEDCWYSCPKAVDGCCDDLAGEDCRCGADDHNARIDAVLAAVSDETGAPRHD